MNSNHPARHESHPCTHSREALRDSHPITLVPYDQVRTVKSTPVMTVGSPDSDDLKSGDLSLDLVRDDGLLVLADFKPLSN